MKLSPKIEQDHLWTKTSSRGWEGMVRKAQGNRSHTVPRLPLLEHNSFEFPEVFGFHKALNQGEAPSKNTGSGG